MLRRSRFLQDMAVLPILHDCHRRDLIAVARIVEVIDLAVGQVRPLPDDTRHDALVVAGRAVLFRHGRAIGTLQQGDPFTAAVPNFQAPEFSAVAVCPLKILVAARRATGLAEIAPTLWQALVANREHQRRAGERCLVSELHVEPGASTGRLTTGFAP